MKKKIADLALFGAKAFLAGIGLAAGWPIGGIIGNMLVGYASVVTGVVKFLQ